jgi:hypothetical protein
MFSRREIGLRGAIQRGSPASAQHEYTTAASTPYHKTLSAASVAQCVANPTLTDVNECGSYYEGPLPASRMAGILHALIRNKSNNDCMGLALLARPEADGNASAPAKNQQQNGGISRAESPLTPVSVIEL